MELHKIRGGDERALRNREYNIGVGISLGNKWFSPENIAEATKWALEYTKEYVVVYVADSIHSINLEVRNRIDPARARRRALAAGQELLEKVKALCPQSQAIHFAHWDDVVTEDYQGKVDYLYSLYRENHEFKDRIHQLVSSHTSKEERRFTELEIDKLGTYILEELPEVIARVPIAGFALDAYAYPFDGELPVFIEQLQSGLVFPEVRQHILDTEPKVFLEVR